MSRARDLMVERVHHGEASDEERLTVEADPDASARLASLPEQDAAFHASHDADAQLDAIRRRARVVEAEAAWASRRRWMGVGGVLVPVLAAVALFVAVPRVDGPEDSPSGERAKGLKASLVVHRKQPSGDEVLADGATAREGDVLQLAYVPGDASHGVLLSVDGRGAVTLHHPASVGGSTRLERGGEQRLSHGYALDDAPSFERFFLVTDDAPLDVEAVVGAAEALGAHGAQGAESLALSGVTQSTFLVRKAAPRKAAP